MIILSIVLIVLAGWFFWIAIKHLTRIPGILITPYLVRYHRRRTRKYRAKISGLTYLYHSKTISYQDYQNRLDPLVYQLEKIINKIERYEASEEKSVNQYNLPTLQILKQQLSPRR